MLFLELNKLEDVENLCKICDKYKEKMYVDIKYGRYVIDGCSILAVTSLLGKTIKVCPITDDNLLKEYFIKDVVQIGGYEVKK